MIKAQYLIGYSLTITFCLLVNFSSAQNNAPACELPVGITHGIFKVLPECIQHLEIKNIPSELKQEIESAHANDQWIKFRASNASPIPKSLVLSLGIPDAFAVTIWQINNAHNETILRLNEQSSFYDRKILQRQLQVNMTLAAAQTTEWIIFYRTYGKTSLDLELIDPQQIFLIQNRNDLSNGMVFGIMLVLIILLVLLLAFYHAEVSYYFYAVLVLGNIFFIAQIDGYMFAYVWPYSPHWNVNAPLFFNFISVGAHITFAINYLQLSWRYPHVYKIHLWMLVLGCIVFALQFISLNVELQALYMASYFMLAVVTSWMAMRDHVPSARFYFMGTFSLMFFSVVMFAIGTLWKNIFPQINILTYPKIGIILESLFFTMALTSQLLSFNRRQAELRLHRLTETEQLLAAEQARSQAMALAEQRQLQLASASHDISQPLASIRFAMSALNFSDDQQKVTAHIDKTLHYAQTLLKDILDQSRKDWALEAEKISLPLLFDQLEREFTPLAHAKKLQLCIIYSRLECAGSSLILYRILNNLLANAIRYTGKGRVILGVRRRELGIEIQVGDTGIGIPQPLIRSLLQPFQQGEQTQQGYGLGLFIVRSVCFQSGYTFSLRSKPNIGTLFSVYIPFTDK